MTKRSIPDYTLFLGCMIPYRYPFIEKASRIVLDKLGVKVFDVEGFTCCPDPTGVKPMNYQTWLSVGGRNLAVAENHERNIMTFCTGCFETLSYVNKTLQKSPDLKADVNQVIQPLGYTYQGTLNIKHIVHALYHDIGYDRIQKLITTPFSDLRVVVQDSCHLTKPSDIANFDNPYHPTIVDKFVELTGASVIDYRYQGKCCGAAVSRTDKDLGARIVLDEQLSFREVDADVILTVCPTCYTQLTGGQISLRKELENQIPVLYLTELLALAMGVEPDSFGLNWHRPSATSILEKRKSKEESA